MGIDFRDSESTRNPILQLRKGKQKWKRWQATLVPGICPKCYLLHDRIFHYDDKTILEIPVHDNCRCRIEDVPSIMIGSVTAAGVDGVDLYLAAHGHLPENYISKQDAIKLGWKQWAGNLSEVAHGKIIGGDIYANRRHILPEVEGRVWYEADFDYDQGYRNTCRILFSNDGLLFVTYDHYRTFYEISLEEQE